MVAFSVNFILFFIKLYIGLSSNSISIYSDGINNLFDSLSGLLSTVCFMLVTKNAKSFIKPPINKIEQFLSFVLSVLVGAAGFVFAYSSFERLMYPTPIWYNMKYLYILASTAIVKLLLFLFFKAQHKKSGSQIIKILCFDSLLDFFITAVTILGFVLSDKATFAVDALCGMFISIIILISAVRLIISSGKRLTDYIDKKTVKELENILSEYGINEENSRISFSAEEKTAAYLKTDIITEEEKIKAIKSKVAEKTDIQLYIVY